MIHDPFVMPSMRLMLEVGIASRYGLQLAVRGGRSGVAQSKFSLVTSFSYWSHEGLCWSYQAWFMGRLYSMCLEESILFTDLEWLYIHIIYFHFYYC
jgi:hypothetical protein